MFPNYIEVNNAMCVDNINQLHEYSKVDQT